MTKGGCGSFIFVATFIIIGFACDVDTPPPVDPIKQAADDKAAELAAKKEAAIVAQKKHRISQREKHDSAKFKAEIERRNLGALITSATVDHKHLTVTVANSWHYEPYAVRLQMAQNLYKMWFAITDLNDEESVRVTINDLHGNRVGGQDDFYGVWVDK